MKTISRVASILRIYIVTICITMLYAVNMLAQSTTTFSNTSSMNIPNSGTQGVSSLYPASIVVSGMTGYISKVTVTVTGISHVRPTDIDIVLQSPSGTNVILMSDKNGTTAYATARIFTFNDAAAASLTTATADASGTYKPSNNDTNTDNWTTPGPGALVQASPSLASYNNEAPNGTWKLFVFDDQNARTGSISGGWSITITTLCNVTPVASNNGPVCDGNSLSLSSSGGVSYLWTGPASYSSTQQNPVISSASIGAGGTYTVTVTDQFGCTAQATTTATVNSTPVLSVSALQDVSCYNGNDGQVTLSATNGTGPFSFTDGNSTNATGLFTGYVAGTYNYVVTDNNNCVASAQATVSQPGIPTIAEAGNEQSLCNATSINLAGNAPSYGTGVWTIVSGSATIVDPANPTTAVTDLSIGATVFRWTITPGPCASTYDDVTIYNHAGVPSDPDSVYGTDHACPPVTGEVFYTNTVPGAVSYLWFVGPTTNGVTFTTAVNDTSVTANFAATTNSGYSIRVTAVNGCGTSVLHAGLFVRRTVSTPQLSGPSTLCAGSTGTYTIPTSVAGAVSYTWTAPSGALINGASGPLTSTSMNVNVTLPAVFTTGNVCVSATGPCGLVTTQRCITVRSTPARPSKMNGPFRACPGTVEVYSTGAVNGAVSYNWTAPAHAAVISGQGTQVVQVAFDSEFTGGNITVSVSNPCATGTVLTKTILLSVPDEPGNISGTVNGLCGNANVAFTVPADPASTFNWDLPTGAVILSGAGTNSIIADLSAVSFPSVANSYLNVCVSRTNICGTGDSRCINIQGVTGKPVAVTGPSSVCQNQTNVTYSIPALQGATSYFWTAPPGASVVSGQGTTQATINFGTSAGKVGVRGINACGHGGTRTLAVAITCRESSATGRVAPDIYPNPVENVLNISFQPDSESASKLAYSIFDVSGRMIYSSTMDATDQMTQEVIDFSGFDSGVYFIHWNEGSYSGTEKIIKL